MKRLHTTEKQRQAWADRCHRIPIALQHGETRGKWSKEYQSYRAMRERCRNPNHISYQNYGGRGIRVCERWGGLHSFKNFLADMGRCPGTGRAWSIDRIDVDKDYGPDNCRWATALEQANNKRQSIEEDAF